MDSRYTRRLVPRIIPASELVVVPVLILSGIVTILGFSSPVWSLIGTIPFFF